jgi:hypothetical protein
MVGASIELVLRSMAGEEHMFKKINQMNQINRMLLAFEIICMVTTIAAKANAEPFLPRLVQTDNAPKLIDRKILKSEGLFSLKSGEQISDFERITELYAFTINGKSQTTTREIEVNRSPEKRVFSKRVAEHGSEYWAETIRADTEFLIGTNDSSTVPLPPYKDLTRIYKGDQVVTEIQGYHFQMAFDSSVQDLA